MSAGRDLQSVRAELRRLGYLDAPLDRFLLQDGFRPRRTTRALAVLSCRLGLVAGSVAAASATAGLAAANGLPARPLEWISLYLHLLLPLTVGMSLLCLAACGVLAAALRGRTLRHVEAVSFGVSLAAGVGILAASAWSLAQGRAAGGHLILAAVLSPVAAFLLARVLHDGLVALALLLTRSTPERPVISGRLVALVIAASSGLLAIGAAWSLQVPGPRTAAPEALAPSAGRALLVGLDGVLASEWDYLLARGELPAVRRLATEGGLTGRYDRDPSQSPATFWTGVSTGVGKERHGVVSLDGYRPAGVSVPLTRSGPFEPWWSAVATPVGLAEHRPVLSTRRQAHALWELVGAAGDPVLAVNWWATFPVEPLPGLVVAHGGLGLLERGVDGAAHGSGRLAAAMRAAEREPDEALRAGLGAEEARRVDANAFRPDRFAREVLRDHLDLQPRLAALYLPGLDVAAHGWSGGEVAFADLVRAQLLELDDLVGDIRATPGWEDAAVALVIDPGRRGGTEGRVVLAAPGCPGEPSGVVPVDLATVTAALARAVGLPQSDELADPTPDCTWPPPHGRVPSHGVRRPEGPAGEAREYLESLRSLGYL